MGNGLEITIISVLGGISVALAILGGTGFFWLASRIDRLSETSGESLKELNEKISETRGELNEKIDQRHNELNEKIDERHRDLCERMDRLREDMMRQMDQLREDMTRQMDQMKGEIISALVNHTHPEPGGPPVFAAPPPATRPDEQPAQNGAPAQSATEPEPSPADN